MASFWLDFSRSGKIIAGFVDVKVQPLLATQWEEEEEM